MLLMNGFPGGAYLLCLKMKCTILAYMKAEPCYPDSLRFVLLSRLKRTANGVRIPNYLHCRHGDEI
jgi:hypothetical protein